MSTEGPRSPLSLNQLGIWLECGRAGDVSTYNAAVPLRFRGAFDVAALREAFAAFAARHAILRTTFHEDGAGPHQRVEASLVPSFVAIDAAGWSDERLRAEARRHNDRVFDLSRENARVTVFRIAADDHVVVFTNHHIAFDLTSTDVMFTELPLLYTAAKEGRAAELPPVGATYLDWVEWQSALLESSRGTELETFWRDHLRGADGILDLKTDRRRPPRRRVAGGSVSFIVPAEVVHRLSAIQPSVFRTLLAAYAILLRRMTRQEELFIATPMDGRSTPEVSAVCGDFVNVVPLRVTVDERRTFRALVDDVVAELKAASRSRDLPFGRILAVANAARDASRTPLVQTSFSLNRMRVNRAFESFMLADAAFEAPFADLTVTAFGFPQQEGQLDLSVWMAETSRGLTGEVKYATDLFTRASAERIASHFVALLASLAENPDAPVSGATMLTDEERSRILGELRGEPMELPSRASVPELVIENARRTPNALAVADEHERYTYEDLARVAAGLAARLRADGVGRGDVVAVCMAPSARWVAAQLGVMMTGAAYLPFDPTVPEERIAWMLEDSKARVVIVDDAAPASVASHGMRLGERAADIEDVSKPSPDDVAYLIYTSGSTGKPKAALVEHGGLTNLVFAKQRVLGTTAADHCTQVAAPAFDATVYEIWPCLSIGAALHIAGGGVRKSPESIVQWLRDHAITEAFLPTPMAEAVLAEDTSGLALRVLAIAGEALRSRPRPDTPFAVFNLYGPTEATVWSTVGRVTAAADDAVLPDIGRPVPNVDVYVLDEQLAPVGIGVPGELCIGGIAVARGYLNRPELTAEKFVVSPFDGKRLYRTGDLVRWLERGAIEFLGRIDQQVKIRGYRIELGEIEAALLAHPAVSKAAVVALDARARGLELVAYVAVESPIEPAALRAFLGTTLPEYMVPSAVVTLPDLPLTPNGKIDRRALPAPDLEPEARVEPATELERIIAAAWATALGQREVGATDELVALGGHSLVAARIATDLRRTHGLNVAPGDVLARRTVRALAELVEATRAAPLVTLGGASAPVQVVAVHDLSGGIEVYRALASALDPDVGVVALTIDAAPDEAIGARARRYVDRVTSIGGPLVLLGWSYGGVLAYAIAAELEARGRPPALVVLVDAVAPSIARTWDAQRGPLAEVRARAGVLGDDATFAARVDALLAYDAPPIASPVLLFRASVAPGVALPPRNGWPASSLEVIPATGDHFSVLSPPNAGAIASALRDRLRK